MTTELVGRSQELDELYAAVVAGRHVLIKGRTGIGKTTLMQALFERYKAETDDTLIWVPQTTTKQALMDIAQALHETIGLKFPADLIAPTILLKAQREGYLPWKSINRPFHRLPVAEVCHILIDTAHGHRVTVFLESLEVPPSQADFYRQLIDHVQIIAGIDSHNRRSRIEKLLWKFHVKFELPPLTLDASRELAERWVAQSRIRFAGEDTRERFIRGVAQDSGGIPEALRGMIEAAEGEEEITPAKVRLFQHDAARRYFDMTPLVLLSLLGFMVMRYVSRGMDDRELWVWAGIGSTLFIAARLVYGGLRMKR